MKLAFQMLGNNYNIRNSIGFKQWLKVKQAAAEAEAEAKAKTESEAKAIIMTV